MGIQSVKKKSRRFLGNQEIFDYTNYEPITLIHPSPPAYRQAGIPLPSGERGG
jgi:hypothetical protein